MNERAPKKKVDKKCKQNHDVRAFYKIQEDIWHLTAIRKNKKEKYEM